MKPIRKLLLLALALVGSLSAAGCVYYPARAARGGYVEYYPDGYTPYYTNHYARPYVGAIWISGANYRGHYVHAHWR